MPTLTSLPWQSSMIKGAASTVKGHHPCVGEGLQGGVSTVKGHHPCIGAGILGWASTVKGHHPCVLDFQGQHLLSGAITLVCPGVSGDSICCQGLPPLCGCRGQVCGTIQELWIRMTALRTTSQHLHTKHGNLWNWQKVKRKLIFNVQSTMMVILGQQVDRKGICFTLVLACGVTCHQSDSAISWVVNFKIRISQLQGSMSVSFRGSTYGLSWASRYYLELN